MLLDKNHAIIIMLLPVIVLTYNMSCPDRSQKQLQSQVFCIMKKESKSVYTCLEDIITETFIESCSEKEDVVRPGTRYVIIGQSTGYNCSTDRYQPIPFYKSSGSMCILLKSTCTEVGQVLARNGSGLADTTCICDYSKGYAYVTSPRDVCNCVPSEEDCTCYVKECTEKHRLSTEYNCLPTNASMTRCAKVDRSDQNVTPAPTTTLRTDYTELNKPARRLKYVGSPFIQGCATLTLVAMIFSFVIAVLYKACTMPNLMNIKVDKDIRKKYEEPPLCAACRKGQTDRVTMLLENTEDIDKGTWNGESPLYVACQGGYKDIVTKLVNNNANINKCTLNGETPLYIACKEGRTDIVTTLVDNNADINQCTWDEEESPLYIACKGGFSDIVTKLIKNNAKINKSTLNKETPLYIACKGKYTNIVTLLISKNAKINKCTLNGESPLYIACKEGCTDIVTKLLDNNADIKRCTVHGETPLGIASEEGHTDIVTTLKNKLGRH